MRLTTHRLHCSSAPVRTLQPCCLPPAPGPRGAPGGQRTQARRCGRCGCPGGSNHPERPATASNSAPEILNRDHRASLRKDTESSSVLAK